VKAERLKRQGQRLRGRKVEQNKIHKTHVHIKKGG
jgi:hypothetical protein